MSGSPGNREVLQSPHGLRTIKSLGRHLNLTQRIVFFADVLTTEFSFGEFYRLWRWKCKGR